VDIEAKNVWAITPQCVRYLSSTPHVQVARLDRLILSRTAVFVAQSPGPTELSDAKGFIDTASSHGIAYFVYSSVDHGCRTLSDSDPSYCKAFSDKFYIEQHLKSVAGKGMDYTIIRPTWFADNAY
jgi:hypothetical protein